MIATYCLDASAALGLLLREPLTARVEEFWLGLQAADEVVTPQLFLPECTAAIRRRVHRGEITQDEAVEVLANLVDLPLRMESNTDQFSAGLELARRLRAAKAYDSQYLAVAMLASAELVTLDRGMYQAARQLNVKARLIQ